MQTTTSLTGSNFRSECHIQTIFVGEITDNPFSQNQLICSILDIGNQKFYFVLLIDFIFQREVADFGVTIFNQTANLRDIEHALSAELFEFGERGGFMVTLLIGGLIELFFIANNVVFQLAHRLKVHARHLIEGFHGFLKDVFGRVLHRLSVLVEIGAKERECGDGSERIHKSGAETRNDIHVAGTSMNESREDIGTVNSFAT